jgi:hypothetical protein
VSDDLLSRVESLKLLLVSHATGQHAENQEYQLLRRELCQNPRVSKKLPRMVHICRDLSEFWSFIKPKFGTYAERREYIRSEFDPILTMLESDAIAPSDSSISKALRQVDSDYVHESWQKALERRATDPQGAITAARALLESVCKHILDQSEVAYDETADLPKLYGMTARQLNLSPSQHTEQVFKQILGGCQTVVEGLGALRNRLSDAHGKRSTAIRPAARHAELAVNLSGTMATFLMHTWQARTLR